MMAARGSARRRSSASAETASSAVGLKLSDSQFRKLAKLVYRISGISLGEDKRDLLRARLAKRFRTIGVQGIDEYIQRLENDTQGHEIVGFLDCVTTNKTDFFREPQHFDFMARQVFPQIDRICARGENYRIWSAACSSGEEPYTLAMVALENQALLGGRQVEILASDLSTKVLSQAGKGIYPMERVAGIPRNLLTAYFQKGQGDWQGHVRLKASVRSLVSYRRINLMERFDFKQVFHAIFCRNVMIYFDKETRSRLVDKFKACLPKGGYLFVGHSESLTGLEHKLKFVRPAVYRKED